MRKLGLRLSILLTLVLVGSTLTGAAPVAAQAAPDLGRVTIRLVKIGQVDQAIAMTWCTGHAEPYVAGKGGRVSTLRGRVVLDISGEISTGNEQGLLGLVCSRDGRTMYVSYTNRAGDTRVDAMTWSADRSRLVRASARTVLSADQPAANHNGGNVALGPDGVLWFGFGDGGGGNDTYGNGQRDGTVLGKIVRVPAANQPQIMIKGVRNPWRFSFDRETRDLWIGDVGQGALEEIDKLAYDRIRGANLGWPAFEGTRRNRDVAAPGAIPPVFEYGRSQGQAVVGGYVYRGKAKPNLRGAYLFADTYTARLRAIVVSGNRTVAERQFGEIPGGLVGSFAEGPGGEVYVLSLAGGIYGIQ
jgi:glucose/arabinose dehydrogenase